MNNKYHFYYTQNTKYLWIFEMLLVYKSETDYCHCECLLEEKKRFGYQLFVKWIINNNLSSYQTSSIQNALIFNR